MAPVSIDDLIASLKGSHVGQEMNDLDAVKAHFSKTLGSSSNAGAYQSSPVTGFVPARNTPQGTPVTTNPPAGAPWGDHRSRRKRSQSRGMDMAIDEEEPVQERDDRWRPRSQRKGPPPTIQDISMGPSAPMSPPASPTAPFRPSYTAQQQAHSTPIPIQPLVPQDFQSPYAASSDPFLASQAPYPHPVYNGFFTPPEHNAYGQSGWPASHDPYSPFPGRRPAPPEIVTDRTR